MINIITINELFDIVLHVSLAYGQIFLLCTFGQTLLDHFEKMSVSIFACEWYRFPVDAQKLLNAMAVAAQRPVYIRGFGSSACTHESLKEVLDTTKINLQSNDLG